MIMDQSLSSVDYLGDSSGLDVVQESCRAALSCQAQISDQLAFFPRTCSVYSKITLRPYLPNETLKRPRHRCWVVSSSCRHGNRQSALRRRLASALCRLRSDIGAARLGGSSRSKEGRLFSQGCIWHSREAPMGPPVPTVSAPHAGRFEAEGLICPIHHASTRGSSPTCSTVVAYGRLGSR